MNTLECKSLSKFYGEKNNQVKAVNDISFTIKRGEFISIIGQSGAGKSTLMHMMGGLEKPSKGIVMIDGISIYDLKENELSKLRRKKIGFIFQSFNLIPTLSVWENIILPISLDDRYANVDEINNILVALKIDDKKYAMPTNLSGGEQQRVAIARAIASNPSIILADEPTGNLDSQTSMEVLNLLKESVKVFNKALVVVTHNKSVADLAERTIIVNDGKIVEIQR